MEYLDAFNTPISRQNKFDFFDLRYMFENNMIFGAPYANECTFQKIKDIGAIEKESPETIKDFTVANMQSGGVRCRFHTSSKRIVIKAELVRKFSIFKMCLCGSSGFDIYAVNGRERKHITAVGPSEPYNIFADIIELPCEGDYEIFFPLYNQILNINIGVDKGSVFDNAKSQLDKRYIIFYGHSATQGASASRSGNSYPNIVARKLNQDIFNYSFSGACRAEISMAEQIASAHKAEDVGAIVVDYNRNAYTVTEFSNRYLPFYNKLREFYPDTPIILVGAFMQPYYDERIVKYLEPAMQNGDNTVFIDLQELFSGIEPLSLTMDKLHYTDKGMFMIANKICELLPQFNK